MATFNTFEEIDSWQIARILSSEIYKLILRPDLSKDYALKDQMNRASGSIMDNIAEGFERGGNKEFINFLGYSKGSCGELKSQLYRAFDRKYITSDDFQNKYEMANNIGKMNGKLIEYLNQSEIKGLKFKNRI